MKKVIIIAIAFITLFAYCTRADAVDVKAWFDEDGNPCDIFYDDEGNYSRRIGVNELHRDYECRNIGEAYVDFEDGKTYVTVFGTTWNSTCHNMYFKTFGGEITERQLARYLHICNIRGKVYNWFWEDAE